MGTTSEAQISKLTFLKVKLVNYLECKVSNFQNVIFGRLKWDCFPSRVNLPEFSIFEVSSDTFI